MAIQISGTTIIDDYKRLTNIDGYSGHMAGFYTRITGTGTTNVDFRISNIYTGRARLIVSGWANYPIESFYGVYDVFGNLNANTTNVYNFKEVAQMPSSSGYSYFFGSKTNTYFLARGRGFYNNSLPYVYAWDLYYNVGNLNSIPTLTIVNT